MATATSTSTTSAAAAAAGPAPKITLRKSASRGHANHTWLYTFHTFSFASYHSPQFPGYGPLRVINEDRVQRNTGFGAHSHSNFAIWSYLVAGELEHKDSLGNVETLQRGDVQFTNAGSGIRHSEYNRNSDKDNHFLQIWAVPGHKDTAPEYVTRRFEDEEKRDRLCRIIESVSRLGKAGAAGDGAGPIGLDADLTMEACILSPGSSVAHEVLQRQKGEDRKLYAHVVMGGKSTPESGGAAIGIGDAVLREGDGAFIEGASGTLDIKSVGDVPAEFLLFDMGQ